MNYFNFLSNIIIIIFLLFISNGRVTVVTTWNFPQASQQAFNILAKPDSNSVDAIEAGCKKCEELQCDGSVGFGGSPDELGDVSLDAMLMNGKTREIGCVANLRNTKNAISVARAVSDKTFHSFLVGAQADLFAEKVGFPKESLRTPESDNIWNSWIRNGRKPNYWKTFPLEITENSVIDHLGAASQIVRNPVEGNHDTVSMVAIDSKGNIACGSSTNGLRHKIPGRIADSSIVGSGAYCENGYGGAVSTGNGDVIMRMIPAARAVFLMRYLKISAKETAVLVMKELEEYYPNTNAAVIVVNGDGTDVAAAATGGFRSGFVYLLQHNNETIEVMKPIQIPPLE